MSFTEHPSLSSETQIDHVAVSPKKKKKKIPGFPQLQAEVQPVFFSLIIYLSSMFPTYSSHK